MEDLRRHWRLDDGSLSLRANVRERAFHRTQRVVAAKYGMKLVEETHAMGFLSTKRVRGKEKPVIYRANGVSLLGEIVREKHQRCVCAGECVCVC